MNHNGAKTTAETECKRKKGVILPLVCMIAFPGAYVGLLSDYLPDWLDVIVVGTMLLVYSEIIAARCTGVFRRKK